MKFGPADGTHQVCSATVDDRSDYAHIFQENFYNRKPGGQQPGANKVVFIASYDTFRSMCEQKQV